MAYETETQSWTDPPGWALLEAEEDLGPDALWSQIVERAWEIAPSLGDDS